MMIWRSLLALCLALSLMLGSVVEGVARSEMAGASDLVLCSGMTVTVDAAGNAVSRHPCTHCLAAAAVAVLQAGPVAMPPVTLALSLTRLTVPASRTLQAALTPSARGPPALRT